MSGITDPAQEYFKNGLWAWVTDQWKKLTGDAAGHLQVDVVASGLPAGASTSANQTTMITALQLIDDLRTALNSIGTDELDVVIDGQSADVEITQQAAADLTPGIMGWDGSTWRKLPMVWGYSEHWAELVTDTASGAGHATAVSGTISSGYVYVLQAWSSYHNAGVAKALQIYLHRSAVKPALYHNLTQASATHAMWTGEIVLRAGDTLESICVSAGDGKTVYLHMWGYKMKVAE